MVFPKSPKAWLANTTKRSNIGILAFESATTMSRLVSLHHFLSDSSLRLLRSDIMRSPGIAYLTSTDQHLLFNLIFSDLISDLDSSASSLSRLSQPFSLTYSDLKSGRIPFSIKGLSRCINQMEKNIAMVSKLLEQIETLDAMAKKKPPVCESRLKSENKKLAAIKEGSLWSKTIDEVVSLMSRVIIAIFARICIVFGPHVDGLPPFMVASGRFSFTQRCRIYPRLTGRHHASGPMERSRSPAKEVAILRNSCPIIGRGRRAEKTGDGIKKTVGKAGLGIRYANLVLMAEKLMSGEEEAATREEIYLMLPANMERMVKGRLRERWRERGLVDGEMAKGWKEAVERIMIWLSPVARDTVTWHEEKTLDRRRRLEVRPRVLRIQTFEFSDKEKTEAAIVEVLVGISCMCWYDGRPVAGR